MNKHFSYLFLSVVTVTFFCSILFAGFLQAAQLVDKVVAIVNDDIITMSEVNETGKGYFQQIKEQAPPSQMDEALRQARAEVLNNLIDSKLIALVAEKNGVFISDDEVQAAADQMLVRNDISKETMETQLAERGMTYEGYLDTLRNQILQSKLVNYEIRSKLIITEDMILDYYDKNYTKHISGGGYYLLQMGFVWGKDTAGNSSTAEKYADKTDAKKRAERVLALVQNGQDFRMLARKFSDLPSAPDGGDLGVFQLDEMAPYMKRAVLSLQAGETSEIVETPSGYQFFKVLSGQDGQIIVQASLASVKEEIEKKLYDQMLTEQFDEWVTRIKQEAYIKKL